MWANNLAYSPLQIIEKKEPKSNNHKKIPEKGPQKMFAENQQNMSDNYTNLF